MIVGSFEPMEIGKQYSDWIVTDENAHPYRVPLVVLREVTEEDWVAEQIAKGISEAESRNIVGRGDFFYYEISVD